jgi:hypothetical protein
MKAEFFSFLMKCCGGAHPHRPSFFKKNPILKLFSVPFFVLPNSSWHFGFIFSNFKEITVHEHRKLNLIVVHDLREITKC